MQKTHDFFYKENCIDFIKIYKGLADKMLDDGFVKDAYIFMSSNECVKWITICWANYVWKGTDVRPWDPSISSARDYADVLFKHADELKHTYRTIVNAIRQYVVSNADLFTDNINCFQRSVVRVAGTGLIGKHGNINMRNNVVDFDARKWIDSVNVEPVLGEANQSVAVINLLTDMFVNKEIQLEFNSDVIRITFIELHLFYYFQSMFMGAMIRAIVLNGAKYGDILYFLDSQYHFVFKNKTSQYASFNRYDNRVIAWSFELSKDKKRLLRTFANNKTELSLINNNPYKKELSNDNE